MYRVWSRGNIFGGERTLSWHDPFTAFTIPAAVGGGAFDVFAAPEGGKPNGGRIISFANVAIFHGPTFVTFNLSTFRSKCQQLASVPNGLSVGFIATQKLETVP